MRCTSHAFLQFSQAGRVRYHVSNILHRTKAFHTFRVGSIFIEGIEGRRGVPCLFKLAERVLRIKFTYCNSFIQLSPLSFWLVALSFRRTFANKKYNIMCAFLLLFLWLIAAKKSNERRDPPFFLARQKPPFHGHVFVGCIARVIWLYLHIFAFYYADRQKALEGRAVEIEGG